MTDGTIILEQNCLGSRIQNVMVFTDIPTDSVGRQEVADAIYDQYNSLGISNHLHTQWDIFGVTFRYNDSLPIFSVLVPFTAGAYNGVQSSPQASQVAMLVSTQYVGATPNRGRAYFGGFAENALNNSGLFTSPAMDDFTALMEYFRDGIPWNGGANVAQLRIARRAFDGTIATSNPVETVLAQENPASQRRRRIGQGI